MQTLTMNDGVTIPQLGFGVFKVADDDTAQIVRAAFEAGYRHIDTARIYGNERGVGQAVADSSIPREELFIVTKVWQADQGYDATFAAVEASRRRLGLDYIDLLLIHWPAPARDLYLPTWQAFEKLQADGVVRSIGVSNFTPDHLRRLVENSSVVPALNQVECHPALVQQEVRATNAEYGVLTEAWSPLARAGAVLTDPTIAAIGTKYGKSPAQTILRWHLDLGNVVIPKSVTPTRIAENIDVFDFALTAEDVDAISALNSGLRTGPDPVVFGNPS